MHSRRCASLAYDLLYRVGIFLRIMLLVFLLKPLRMSSTVVNSPLVYLFFHFILISLTVSVCRTRRPEHLCHNTTYLPNKPHTRFSQKRKWEQRYLSPFTKWMIGIKTGSPALTVSDFQHNKIIYLTIIYQL